MAELEFAKLINVLFSFLTIAANLISLALIAAYFFPKLRLSAFGKFFHDRGLVIAFIVSLLATLGSLTYSDVLHYEPCKLCWFQRIFMYPQVILMAIAWARKDGWIKLYGGVLSVLGGLIAVYHYLGQLGWNPFGLECLAIGYSASCSKNFVFEYGYITIPFMAFSAFLLIALTLFLPHREADQK